MNSGPEDEATDAEGGIHAGHIRPRFWIAPGVFHKELNSKDFAATGSEAAADARQTGWTPRATAMGDDTDELDPDAHTHNALQHLGIGAGHEAYYSMMETFAGSIMSSYDRKSLVKGRRLNERLDAKTISGASFRDLSSFAMLSELAKQYYERHGRDQMETYELRFGRGPDGSATTGATSSPAARHRGPYTSEELVAMESLRRPDVRSPITFVTLVKDILEPLSRISDDSGQDQLPPAKRKADSIAGRRARLVGNLVYWHRRGPGIDIYPAIRLVAPELDLEAGPSCINAETVGRILPRAIGCDIEEQAAWTRKAAWETDARDENGHPVAFIDACRDLVGERPKQSPQQQAGVDRVSKLLDQLADAATDDELVNVLARLYGALGSREFIWALRIMLRDVRLGVGDIFLESWHRQAGPVLRSRSCLRMVCWALADPDAAVGEDDLGVKLFSCFQPQDPVVQAKGPDASLASVLERVVGGHGAKRFDLHFVERKLNGQRMQLHMELTGRSDMRFRWWSPDGTDWTHIYGDSLSTGTLARHLGDAFPNDEPGVCVSVVLDGEMLVWDSAANEVLPSTACGPERPHGETRWPVYFAFDMVMLNGKPCTAYALESRWRAMDRAVVGTRNRLEKHTATPVATAEDLERVARADALGGADGVLVKCAASTYQPGLQKRTWVEVNTGPAPSG